MENRAWNGDKVKYKEITSEIECATRQKILYNITYNQGFI